MTGEDFPLTLLYSPFNHTHVEWYGELCRVNFLVV